jgi:hypothetical protein
MAGKVALTLPSHVGSASKSRRIFTYSATDSSLYRGRAERSRRAASARNQFAWFGIVRTKASTARMEQSSLSAERKILVELHEQNRQFSPVPRMEQG